MNSLELVIFLLGVAYTIVWSASFYFQLFLNIKLKSSEGYSLDFQWMNLFGFSYLTASNIHYLLENDASWTSIIDLFFAVHALVISIILYLQTFCYPRGVNRGKDSSYLMIAIIIIMSAIFYIINTEIQKHNSSDLWIFMGLSKSLMSTFKYTYQIFLNKDRKSTFGFSVENVILDFAGGFLSFVQFFLQLWHDNDSIYSNKANLPKFALSCVVMFFDIILLFQHFVLYRNKRSQDPETLMS